MAVKGKQNKAKSHSAASKKKVIKKHAPKNKVKKEVTKPAKKLASKTKVDKKNVSFSSNLEESRLIEDVDTSAVGPSAIVSKTKSILKARKVVANADHDNNTDSANSNPLKGTKKRIIVKKSVKEHLLTLPKKERRDFIRTLRAKTRPNFELTMDAKKIWEKLRSSKTPNSEKATLKDDLYEKIQGKCSSLVYAHDTSRVIQCLMATGDEEVRDKLFDELTPELVRMSKSPYAKFFVSKMLKLGNKTQRNLVFRSFQGHCVQLLRNKWSSTILENLYNDVANADQRNSIVREFYGKEYVIFKDDSDHKSLADLAKTESFKLENVMKNINEVLIDVVDKDQRKLSLVHKLLLDYFTYCSLDRKREMVALIKEILPEITHTKEGCYVGMHCVWNADAKDRKIIVKSFKDLAVKACNDEFSKKFLFCLFDNVDDTVLVNKNIVKEIADNIGSVINDPNGVHVLHYLVHPRDVRVIGPGLLKILQQGDDNQYSKKEKSSRYLELFGTVKENLYSYMAANMKELLYTKVSAVLVLDTLEPVHESELMIRDAEPNLVKACFDAIADVCAEEFIPHHVEEGTTPHIVQGGAARFVLTKLLKADAKQVGPRLSDSMAERISDEQLRTFTALNAGCFDLYHMCLASTVAEQKIKQAISPDALSKKGTYLGAKLLFERLTGRKWESS